MKKDGIPNGYNKITPYLTVKNGNQAIDFYIKAFGAVETLRFTDQNGNLGHAELQIGNSRVMVSNEFSEKDIFGPESRNGSSIGFAIIVEDADVWFDRALKAGAKIIRPLEDQFYGERSGQIIDPFGHCWTIITQKGEVSPQGIEQ